MGSEKIHDVIVIGAGAAGIGLGVLFEKMGLNDYIILEKDSIGSSFKQWPSYTRFISPSFAGNAFNAVDLNAVSPDTSPAYSHKTEHLSGTQYAEYLKLVATFFKLNIHAESNVTGIEKENGTFVVYTPAHTFRGRYLVWAGGEFQQPYIPSIPGADLCQHSSTVEEITGDEATIIGGFESGMELAIKLLGENKKVTIIDSKTPWNLNVSDSSLSLTPHTWQRIKPYFDTDQLTLLGNTKVTKITKDEEGYLVHTTGPQTVRATHPPILATGFASLPPVIKEHFTEYDDGTIALTENDESTTVPNVFLIGPRVQHGGAIFCFIYKFRQRLPIVAETIAERLGRNLEVPEAYKRAGMYLKDLSCCTEECAC